MQMAEIMFMWMWDHVGERENKMSHWRKTSERRRYKQHLLPAVFIQKSEGLRRRGIVNCQGFKKWWFHSKEKKKKKEERSGECNYPVRAAWELRCLIIIP